MPTNTAAWQPKPGVPLDIKPAEYTSPADGEILIKNYAVAINPVDWMLQDKKLFDTLVYPTILGNDVAGEVVEVGPNVTRFKPGDRVLGQAIGSGINKPSEGAFQTYTIVAHNMAAHMPASMSFADAAVMPLALGTASCALFEDDQLKLQYPTVPPQPATGQTLLVWGGASAVGTNAIQLAVAAGYEVVATASPKNFDYCKMVGARQVFDYTSTDIVQELVEALKGKTVAGAFHAAGMTQHCYEVIDKCSGNKFVSTALFIPEDKPSGVKANRVFGSTLKDNEVSQAVWVDFISKALAEGTYRALPEPLVVGSGLESLQKGMATQKEGVSAKKIVITL